MEHKKFWKQSWLGLRALAVITVMLLTGTTAWADGVKYIDADGNEQTCTTYTVLQGGYYIELPGGWYVVEGTVTYTGQLRFTGDAHLILADGCEMTVGIEESPISNNAIYADNCSLTIYGQGGETDGKLTTTGSKFGIYAYNISGTINVSINGGQVTATGGTDGIYTYSPGRTANVSINGGQVAATGGNCGIRVQSSSGTANVSINGGQVTATGGTDGIWADNISGTANVSINGGQVTATGGTGTNAHGIYAYGRSAGITLGWTNPTDFIQASNYKAQARSSSTVSVKTAAGQRFVAYNMATADDISANCIIGDASSTTATAIGTDISLDEVTAASTIAGKTLRPLDGYCVKDLSGLSFSGKTAPDFTLSDTPYYIYKANTTEAPVSVTLDYSGVPTGYTPVYTATKTSDNSDVTRTVIRGSTLTMPDYDISVSLKTIIIPSVAITDIDAPAPQSPLDTQATCTTTGVASNIVVWKNGDDVTSGNAEADCTYTVRVTLTSADGYTFDGGTKATLNGNEVYCDVSADGKSLIVTFTFPETTATYTVSLAESAGDASDWSISPTGSIAAETKVTISYTGSKPEGYIIGGYIVKDADGGDVNVTETEGVFSFNMPAKNVTVYGVRYYMTNVPYMTWDDTKKKLVEATTPTDTKVWVLTGGGATILDGGWYVAEDVVSYTSQLRFTGDAHLILVDGCNLTVGTEASSISGTAIYAYNCSLTIYGQGGETGGKLTATGIKIGIYAYSSDGSTSVTINGGQVAATSGSDGIYTYSPSGTANVSINGGQVTATGSTCGIRASTLSTTATVTINGGQVTATSTGTYCIYARSSSGTANVTINGGQVTADGSMHGIYAHSFSGSATITLGWTNPTDFIQAIRYKAEIGSSGTASVKIADGYYFNYEGNTGDPLTGTITDLDAIAGKKLFPVQKTATGGEKYITYVSNKGNWILNDPNAQVYIVTGYDTNTGQVILAAVTGNEIPEGVPVIIGTDGSALDTDLLLVGEEKLSDGATEDVASAFANFTAGDGTKTMADLLYDATGSTDTSDYLAFVLEKGVFKPVVFSESSVPAAGACILFVNKLDVLLMAQNASSYVSFGSARLRGIPFALGGDATGIDAILNGSMSNETWYDLQGRRLDQAPKAKGVYIYNGIKVVIK